MSTIDRQFEQRKVDPDPISIGLSVLGALGSLASIASYLEGRREQPVRLLPFSNPQNVLFGKKTTSFRTKLRDRITKLDASFEDLKGRLETLQSLLEEIEFLGEVQLAELPFQFGAVRPLLDKQDLALFFRIQNEVNQLCGKITRDCQGLIKLLEEFEKDVPPEIYSKLLQLRSRLNKAIGEKHNFVNILELNLGCIDNSIAICALILEELNG